MENNIVAETLQDYLEFFGDNLNAREKERIAEETELSKSTIYNYLNGAIQDKRKANDIMIVGIKILKERGLEK